ncbi:MAG: hypothetical protein J6A15_00535 [Clostridia bacterium]|nr:hypothetical protein [Clostridia bacterium]
MKEMIYENERGKPSIILNQGFYKNYEYIVLSLHSHPCAYVCIPPNHPFSKKSSDDIHLYCHGGVTFANDKISNVLEYSEKYKCEVKTTIRRNWIIGWDYAHLGDYVAYIPFFEDDKKYTTKKMTEECKFVIDQLEAIK